MPRIIKHKSFLEQGVMEIYTIATAVIRNKDKYLIAKRAETKQFAPNQWEFVSGFIDTTESPEIAILREIKEELHVTANIVRKANPFEFTDNDGKWTVIPFLVELDTQNVRINPEDHSDIKWVGADELNLYQDLKPFLYSQAIQAFLGRSIRHKTLKFRP